MHADPKTEREIFAAVDAFFGHIADRRLEETLAAFAPDPDVALYGSEVGEIVKGPEALRAFFGRIFASVGPRFTLIERRASVAGEVAWFTAEAEVAIGDHVIAPYRMTGILAKRDGRWLWMLFNGSEPRPDRA